MTAMEFYSEENAAPSRILIVAAIQNVLDDVRGEALVNNPHNSGNKKDRERLQSAARYFILRPTSEYSPEPWSFQWMCEQLDVDFEWIAEAVRTGSIFLWERQSMRGHSWFPLKRSGMLED